MDTLMQEVTIDVAGSSTFGRDPKVMASRTLNMIIADGWFQDYMGYENVSEIQPGGKGRGIFTSVRANRLIVVISNKVYSVEVNGNTLLGNKSYNVKLVGAMNSFSGDVFIDENNTNQIAICDKHSLYIYNHTTGQFVQATLPADILPGYVTYQDGYFIITDSLTSQWFLSAVGNGLNWFWGPSGEAVNGAITTKPDLAMAVLRVPGRGNLMFAFGKTVVELWTDINSGLLLPYQRSFSVNMDYGLLSAATLAASDHIVAWLGANEKSGPAIMYSTGAEIQSVSTDGINYRISQLKSPEKSSAFFIKLSGHLIYQLTFYDPADNYTVLYDFTDQKFYDATDENMNFHIARAASFFDNDYYFVSITDGNLYRASASMYTFDYGNGKVRDIPRVRVCSNIRLPGQTQFIVRDAGMTIEQGSDAENNGNDSNYKPRVAMSISTNGGISFGNYVNEDIYRTGRRINMLSWQGLGSSNDMVMQFRFYGRGPWKANNGIANIYK